MELYTSLTRLKMALNGGQSAPMTPLTEAAKRLIDPDLTIGMGALMEDDEKGLRCPVRGCGKWFHHLTLHANNTHREVGGADGIRAALDIPPTATLISRKRAAWYVEHGTRILGPRGAEYAQNARRNMTREGPRRRAAVRTKSLATIGAKNLYDSCPAQLAAKLHDLERKLGRAPTRPDIRGHLGCDVARQILQIWGTLNNCKAQIGMVAYNRKYSPDDIYEALRCFHAVHGRLPTSRESTARERQPMIPVNQTIIGVLKAGSWEGAMSHVAWVLGIDDERYPAPVTVRTGPASDGALALESRWMQ